MTPDLSLALSAARAAGSILARHFGRPARVDFKSPDQPVTDADREADRFLRDALLDARKGYGWISEESSASPDSGGRTWVVDPLDGTANFVRGIPEFAVCIGLVERGTPVLGVVYKPVGDVVYHAERGHGSFRNGEAIHARRSAALPTVVVSATELERGVLAGLAGLGRVETLGSTALKVVRVAEGGADLYVSRTRKGVWDVCAAAAIAAEAGAAVYDAAAIRIDSMRASTTFDGLIVVGPGGEDRAARASERLRAGAIPPEEEETA